MIIFNVLGFVILALAALVGFLIRLIFDPHSVIYPSPSPCTHWWLWAIPSAVVAASGDILYRFKRRDRGVFRFLHPQDGGQLFFVPVWTWMLLAMAFMVPKLLTAGSPASLAKECESLRTREPASCYALADIYLAGSGGVSQSKTRAADYFKLACEKGEAKGCDKAGQIYEEACETGNYGACWRLREIGTIYADGLYGAPKDSAKAVRFFEKACKGGEPNACSSLAAR